MYVCTGPAPRVQSTGDFFSLILSNHFQIESSPLATNRWKWNFSKSPHVWGLLRHWRGTWNPHIRNFVEWTCYDTWQCSWTLRFRDTRNAKNRTEQKKSTKFDFFWGSLKKNVKENFTDMFIIFIIRFLEQSDN